MTGRTFCFYRACDIDFYKCFHVGLWIYRSVATPLDIKITESDAEYKEGNLDFVLEVDGTDELQNLCRDFEEMRRRLKESCRRKGSSG